MAKRKSKTTEFRPPNKTQPRAKRQRSTEETNLQSADEPQIQTPQSENNNSQNASYSDKLDEHQPGQSTLQQFPVDPSCSLEEKTCIDDHNEDGNDLSEVPHEIERIAEITVQTPEHNNSDKDALCRPLNVELTNEDVPDVHLQDEEIEIASNSNYESQKVQDDSELQSDECQDSEPKIAGTSVDETGIHLTEDAGSADPIVKRKIRKRMGMCRLGERKRMFREQPTRGNVFGGEPENEAGQVINKESLMMSDDLKMDGSISLKDEGTTEVEVSASCFPIPCPLEDMPVQEEVPDVQCGNDVQVQILVEFMSSDQEITGNTILSHADDPLVETKCVEQSANETNTPEDMPEMCDDVKIGTQVTIDLAEVCKESHDVSAQDAIVIEGQLEVLKEITEASASTSEVANHFEELLVVRGSEMEVEEYLSEHDTNTSITDLTNEQCAESTDIAANDPVIKQIEDKCESLDCTLVAPAVASEENTVKCEDSSIWSLSLPPAPPCGEDHEVQSDTEHDGLLSDTLEPHPSPAAEPVPSSPLSIDSVTDSQLNNIPLSLEDLPISEAAHDLEDATEMVCGLIRDLASLNQIVRDAHRKIEFLQQSRKPPRPQFRCMYGPPH